MSPRSIERLQPLAGYRRPGTCWPWVPETTQPASDGPSSFTCFLCTARPPTSPVDLTCLVRAPGCHCRMAQAVLLTVVELLLLGADDSQPHRISLDQLLVLMGLVLDKLQTSIGATRGKAALAAFTPSWVQDTSALDAPELNSLITPVMRDVVQLVTPLMLPTCHLVRLPSQQQQPAASSRGPHLPARIARHPLGPGSLRSALFPEQIMVLAASGATTRLHQVHVLCSRSAHELSVDTTHGGCPLPKVHFTSEPLARYSAATAAEGL